MTLSASAAVPNLKALQKAAAALNDVPKATLAHTAQKICGRCLLKGDLVYSTVEAGLAAGSGYVATCSFSEELSSSLDIHEVLSGAVAASKKAAEHNAASAALSKLGIKTNWSTDFAPTEMEGTYFQVPPLLPQDPESQLAQLLQEVGADEPEFNVNQVDGQWQGSVVLRFQGVVAQSMAEAKREAAMVALEAMPLWSSRHVHNTGGSKERDAESFAVGAHGRSATIVDPEFDGTVDYKSLLLRQLQTLFPKGVRTLSEGTDLKYTTHSCGLASASWLWCVQFPCLGEMSTCKPIWSPVPLSEEIVPKKKSLQLVAFTALRLLSTGTRPILPPQVYSVPRRVKNSPCRVFALSKPRGMVATMSTDPSKGGGAMAAWINSILPGLRLFTIGGLDKNTSGLLLVTNDGQFAKEVTAFRGCEKEYWCGVDVARNVDADAADAVVQGTCAHLLGGFEFDHPQKATKFVARAKEARQLLPEEQASALSHATLDEGAGRQGVRLIFCVTVDTGNCQVVKRMMAAAGMPAASQHLERIGNLRLADLQLSQPGIHVELSSEDAELLRSSCVAGQAAESEASCASGQVAE
ncbi:unnamed protein product [Polarella glacialis]|uniref:DRBM domain-containing protein n=2 Tax=Polarella glacialis TaxID=89957 RepID=A0A813JCT2_POLGL|nr:unnamed protein product [Polarella glacialis]